MLAINNLSKKYGKVYAVDDISFSLDSGKCGILLGANGAGKSTIIKCITGLLRYEGDIFIQNIPSRTIEAKQIFGYVPEIPAMFEALTVREHLEYICKAYDIKDGNEKIDELLKRFELADKQEKLGSELSKGMMQKVSICCALIINPKVILFDEPMVGLDPMAIKELKNVIEELKADNVTILISTHMLEMVKDLWDELFIIDKGKIIGEFNRENSDNKDIEEIFFEITGGVES